MTPPRAFYLASLRLNSSPFLLMAEKKDQSSHGALPKRELAEEIGLRAPVLLSVGSTCGTWDGRRDRVNFFELRLGELPELKLDNREVIEARLTSPAELQSMVLTGPLAAYLDKVPHGARGE